MKLDGPSHELTPLSTSQRRHTWALTSSIIEATTVVPSFLATAIAAWSNSGKEVVRLADRMIDD